MLKKLYVSVTNRLKEQQLFVNRLTIIVLPFSPI